MEDLPCGSRLHQIRDELDVQHSNFEAWVGVQEPKERAKVEWTGVSGKFQFHEGSDGEQCGIKGCSSQRGRLEL
jgi:hypothetical protein